MSNSLHQYLWIAIVCGFFGFVYAFGIGANDVANAFSSTVASGSLTLKQAIIAAGIFEFCGAFFLGASVAGTIKGKIFKASLYADEPEVLMLGQMTSIVTATFMLLIATHFELPVSTTHTIVGCLLGFTIVAKGFNSVGWSTVNKIFVSWAVSPLCSGIAGFIFFGTLKYVVLKSENPFQRAYWTFPLVLTVAIGIDVFFILYKGMQNQDFYKKLTLKNTLPSAFAFGAVCGLIWIFIVGPICKRRVENNRPPEKSMEDPDPEEVASVLHEEESDEADGKAADRDMEDNHGIQKPEAAEDAEVETPEVKKSLYQRFADNTYNQDLRAQSMHESHRAAELWEEAELYNHDAEQLFTYLQVFTACLNSFAHGANDVANAIAPVSATIYIYQTGKVASKAPVQKWLLAYGGLGIVLGLLLYGYKVMKSLGYKMTALSPSRGASAELAASLFVVSASYAAIPVSSTQSIVGAVTGVGLVGGLKNIQWMFLLKVMFGWVTVFFAAVFCSAGLFAFCACSPTILNPST